ncbi:glutamate-cysteine ligase family protein [Nonomuraea sp. NPDC050790]|uniref:carboxylate-amine ligase n=1 Tax=Nonomuraea sp. NPDC050790 TaxID=3364371 RepID=UPI0037A5434A
MGTFGVEEEFFLVEAHSGQPAERASAVLEGAGRHPGAEQWGGYHAELHQTQVAATGVCHDLGEIRGQIEHARGALAHAAHGLGLRVLSTATPPLTSAAPPAFTSGDRFRRIGDAYAALVNRYESCGCHVHVGVDDRDTAVAVMNHLRRRAPGRPHQGCGRHGLGGAGRRAAGARGRRPGVRRRRVERRPPRPRRSGRGRGRGDAAACRTPAGSLRPARHARAGGRWRSAGGAGVAGQAAAARDGGRMAAPNPPLRPRGAAGGTDTRFRSATSAGARRAGGERSG